MKIERSQERPLSIFRLIPATSRKLRGAREFLRRKADAKMSGHVGAALGTSTVTAYIESATGVQAGARTGLANLVTGALFFLALFFSPLVRMVGGGVPVENGNVLQPMTAPALIVVGCLMMASIGFCEKMPF